MAAGTAGCDLAGVTPDGVGASGSACQHWTTVGGAASDESAKERPMLHRVRRGTRVRASVFEVTRSSSKIRFAASPATVREANSVPCIEPTASPVDPQHLRKRAS